MATTYSSIKDAFNSCFTKKWIMNTATSTGLVQRERKIRIIDFFWTLILGFGTGANKTIAELRACHETTHAFLVLSFLANDAIIWPWRRGNSEKV